MKLTLIVNRELGWEVRRKRHVPHFLLRLVYSKCADEYPHLQRDPNSRLPSRRAGTPVRRQRPRLGES